MIGFLIGYVNKKTVLVKIDYINYENKAKHLVDVNNATFICDNFTILSITDEFMNTYFNVDIKTIYNDKFLIIKNFKLNEDIYDNRICFYMNEYRALQDLYMYNNKITGIFKQYSKDGDLIGELPLKKGKIHGIYKIYNNGRILIREYKNDIECKAYDEEYIINEL
jgi:antitoxin component YwqK of YwqJK toxin-antitoxin module